MIREARGLNYGDYSYIESFPEGGRRNMPPTNVGRQHQIFEVWIRTLPNEQAHFALRAGIRELATLVDNGLTEDQFELRRAFLQKYGLHFAETTSEQLGYAVDDLFYGLTQEGHLARFKRMMQELTLEEVNTAIKAHLQYEDLKIAIVTGEAEALRRAIVAEEPSPLAYESPKPPAILDEDQIIAAFPLHVPADGVTVVAVEAMFETES
jgi:zinc protease